MWMYRKKLCEEHIYSGDLWAERVVSDETLLIVIVVVEEWERKRGWEWLTDRVRDRLCYN